MVGWEGYKKVIEDFFGFLDKELRRGLENSSKKEEKRIRKGEGGRDRETQKGWGGN